ncbi:nucleotidyltransferase substrate binding protein [bacterium]|nr:MAG: nucleotidyltransferase substrate binding protein [bacterium]
MGKEKVTKKIDHFEKALKTLNTVLVRFEEVTPDYKDYLFIRDSLIQRFEYCTDMFWKVLREFIIEKHGVDVLASPKAVLKEAFDVYLIDEKQYTQLLTSVNDRNLTSHAYQEDVALQIVEYVADSYQLMKIIIEKINQEINL